MVEELFAKTKNDIKEILQSDFVAKIKKYTFKGIDYKFSDDTVKKMLPNLQAINMGVMKEVVVTDVDGNEIVLSAEEFVARNQVGFQNKFTHEIDLNKLLKILEEIQTFTALANFGSFDMAKKFYIENEEEEVVEEEVAEVEVTETEE